MTPLWLIVFIDRDGKTVRVAKLPAESELIAYARASESYPEHRGLYRKATRLS